ncbi:MAG: AI-2E family transporter [Actinobacteria bacterium]|nr:AI-2E family transporter [Actinomycetota bacterium]
MAEPERGARGPDDAAIDLDPRSALHLAIAFVGVALLIGLIRSVPRMLTALAIATLLALALNPLVAAVQRRTRLARTPACAVVLLGLVGLLTAVALLVVPPTARQAADLGDDITEVTKDLGDVPIIGDDLIDADVPKKVDKFLDDLPERLGGDDSPLADVAEGFADGLVAALITLLLAITLLLDGERLVAFTRRLIPRAGRERADRLARLGYQVVGRYVAGSVLVAMMAGMVILVLGLALGVPLAPLAAAWITMTNLIPQIGGALGGVPFVLLGLTRGVGTGVACAAGFLIYQNIENHLVGPVVIGKVVKLSPPVTMAAALIGVSAGGVVGALIAVPVIGAVKTFYLELRPDVTAGPPAPEPAPAPP